MIMETFNGALLFKRQMFEELRDSSQVVRRGAVVMLLVGLLVGGINGIRIIIAQSNPDEQFSMVQAQIEESIRQYARSSATLEERQMIGIINENLAPGIQLLKDVYALPTILPHPVGAVFHGVAVWVSMPWSYLGSTLIMLVFVHIAATWFGGNGTIQQTIGLGMLSLAPRALDALAFIPGLGTLLGMVAFVWSIAILVFSTSIGHRIEIGRATLAILFFPVIFFFVCIPLCCVSVVVLPAIATF